MNAMKTLLIAAALCAGVASAEEPAKPAATPAAAPATAATATPDKVAAGAKAAKRKECNPPSGSRIKPPANGPCKAVIEPYRVWSEKQIRETGEINTGDALEKLDPIIIVQ